MLIATDRQIVDTTDISPARHRHPTLMCEHDLLDVLANKMLQSSHLLPQA